MRVGSHMVFILRVSLFYEYFPTRATHYPTRCNHSRTDRRRVRLCKFPVSMLYRLSLVEILFSKLFSVCLQVMILPPAWIKA